MLTNCLAEMKIFSRDTCAPPPAKRTDPKKQGFGQEFHAERRKHGSQRGCGIWKRDFQLVRQFTGRDGGQAMTSMVNCLYMHTLSSLFKFPSHFSTPKVDQQSDWAFIFLPSVATLKKRFSFFCSPSINLAALTLRLKLEVVDLTLWGTKYDPTFSNTLRTNMFGIHGWGGVLGS